MWNGHILRLNSVSECELFPLLPEAVLEGVDLPSETLAGLSGIIQLPLELPAGCVGPGGLLLRLLQLTLQLLHTRVSFLHLTNMQRRQRVRGRRLLWLNKKSIDDTHLLLVLVSVTALILHLHHHLLQFLLCAADDFVGCRSLPAGLRSKNEKKNSYRSLFQQHFANTICHKNCLKNRCQRDATQTTVSRRCYIP